ncbi:Hypothetical predicted protein [Olea europaea subsp. europaea]|uniref:Uncharacterized protein n=1 Tax=Olea europaea subsp. europaea TaxID=158383 RepID=A0A8S0PQV0_OLEEU|nr:Hypothetical predicted protein [Olea europaea subsp. europaea]
MSNVDCGIVGSVHVEKLRGLVEKIDKLRTKLDVKEGKESVSNVDCDGFIAGDVSVDVETELEDYPHRKLEEGVTSKKTEEDDDEEDLLEYGGSQCSSDGGRESRK